MKWRPTLAGGRRSDWALWDRFEVPQYDGPGSSLTRWRLIQTPWCSLYLHRFDGPDPRSTLHDHPWNFIALVLRGGYVERRLDPRTLVVDEKHHIRWINRVRAGDAHAIISLDRPRVWTLLLVGHRRRQWGYWEPSWVEGEWAWTEFDKHEHALEFDRAMQRRQMAGR